MDRHFVRGDPHGNYDWLKPFTEMEETSTEDVLIILGDAGINYYLDRRDRKLKEKISQLPITLFVIRGNHDYNPLKLEKIKGVYSDKFKSVVYFEPEYPNIIYAAPYGIYHFGDKKALVIGGAYSVDKEYRLLRGWSWFEDEQLNKEERDECIKMIANEPNQNFDYVLTHTCPTHMMPTELFLSFLDQSKVDKTMEEWLEGLHSKIHYDKWYFGHYHGDSNRNEKDILLCYEIVLLGSKIAPL